MYYVFLINVFCIFITLLLIFYYVFTCFTTCHIFQHIITYYVFWYIILYFLYIVIFVYYIIKFTGLTVIERNKKGTP
jgi:hypothetical protein